MSNTAEQIASTAADFQTENGKFESGNKSAGTRARKLLMELKRLCDTRRKEIQAEKNADE